MNIAKIPFVMLFEEQEIDVPQEAILPEYDPCEGISFITNAEGQRVPYVSEDHSNMQTVTKIPAEPTDTNPARDTPK